MRHSRTVAVLALVALAVTSGCVGALGDDSQAQSVESDNRTVTVASNGQATAEADQAIVRISVEARGEDAETARSRLAENTSQLREGLAEAGVDDDQITTSGYNIHEDRRHREADRGDTEYVASQGFEVTLNDTDRAGEVIDAAVASGATRVHGVQFTLSEERREEVRQQALEDAMDSARADAETLASQEDMSIVGAIEVDSAEYNHRPVYHEAAATADAGGGTNIDAGPVTVSAQVRVRYEAQ